MSVFKILTRGVCKALLLVIFVVSGGVQALVLGQTAITNNVLQGVVTDEAGAIIPTAKLVLLGEKGAVRETISDASGNFSFSNLAFGKYYLTVKKEGFAVVEREITFNADSQNSNLVMSAGAVGESVTIVMDSAEAAVESTLKLPISIHETPRSVTVIGEEQIRQQNFRQISDVLLYVPGTTPNSYRNGSYHFYSRGYRQSPEDTRLDGFVGINVGSNGFGASTFGVEEVVVLRGPAGLLYGQTGSPGGFINLISKKPRENRFTRVDLRSSGYQGNGVSFGERPSFGVDVDTTGALTKNNRILYRALFTLENMNYFTRDTLDRNRYANASVSFKLDEDERYVLTPNVQWTRYHRPYGGGLVASPSSSLSAALIGGDPVNTLINKNDLSPLDVNLSAGRRIEETVWGGLDFRGVVTDKLRVNAAYRYVSFDTDINQFAPQVTSPGQITQLRNQNLVSRIQARSLTERDYNNFNADASYEWLKTGWWKNTTQIGFYNRILDSRSVAAAGLPQSQINVRTGQVLTPLVDDIAPLVLTSPRTRDKVWNGFLQNRTSLDNGRWNFIIGFNYGENKPAATAAVSNPAVRKSGFIPNASLVFNATPELAVYGSYSTSFNPVDPTFEDFNGNRGVFDPTIGKSYEVGAKYDLLNRRVNLAFALFQNQIENILVKSDTNFLNSNGMPFYVSAGTRRSRGAEMTGEFQVRQDLRVSGGASYTEAIYKGFPTGLTVSGRPLTNAPIPNSWAEKTPRWSYNVYTRYDRREGYLKGFGAGFGLAWQGKRLGSNGARTFGSPDPLVLPAFTKVDTALFYRLNKLVDFAVNFDNLLNETIFVNATVGSSVEIAAPRAVSFRTSFSF